MPRTWIKCTRAREFKKATPQMLLCKRHWLVLSIIVLQLLSILNTTTAAPIPYDGYFPRIMNLPPFLADPIILLIGPKCYRSLITEFNLADTHCLKYTLSKGLGLGIVVGGSIVKVPQIATIVRNRSAAGLSSTAYYLETAACAIALLYNYRQANPFSTYGEILFLTIQNIMITLLILQYNNRITERNIAAIVIFGSLYALSQPFLVPATLLTTLYALTIPLNLGSKIPQIYANYVNGSTGQLSAFAVFNYLLGTLARVFTTATELNDPLMLSGTILAVVFNGLLAAQMVYYWNKKGIKAGTAFANEKDAVGDVLNQGKAAATGIVQKEAKRIKAI